MKYKLLIRSLIRNYAVSKNALTLSKAKKLFLQIHLRFPSAEIRNLHSIKEYSSGSATQEVPFEDLSLRVTVSKLMLLIKIPAILYKLMRTIAFPCFY